MTIAKEFSHKKLVDSVRSRPTSLQPPDPPQTVVKMSNDERGDLVMRKVHAGLFPDPGLYRAQQSREGVDCACNGRRRPGLV